MRSLIAGVDEAGRSCILSELSIDDKDVAGSEKSIRHEVYALRETPPPQRPPGAGGYHETGLEPGQIFYVLLQMPPNVEHPVHHTDTLNVHTTGEASLALILDAGAHRRA